MPADLVARIRSALSRELLRPAYRRRVDAGAPPTTGHCYVAAEALYHLLGGRAVGLVAVSVRHEGDVHWWVRTADNVDLDPTADQFSTPVPYGEGRARGFLTRGPSRRAREVMRRVISAGWRPLGSPHVSHPQS